MDQHVGRLQKRPVQRLQVQQLLLLRQQIQRLFSEPVGELAEKTGNLQSRVVPRRSGAVDHLRAALAGLDFPRHGLVDLHDVVQQPLRQKGQHFGAHSAEEVPDQRSRAPEKIGELRMGLQVHGAVFGAYPPTLHQVLFFPEVRTGVITQLIEKPRNRFRRHFAGPGDAPENIQQLPMLRVHHGNAGGHCFIPVQQACLIQQDRLPRDGAMVRRMLGSLLRHGHSRMRHRAAIVEAGWFMEDRWSQAVPGLGPDWRGADSRH